MAVKLPMLQDVCKASGVDPAVHLGRSCFGAQLLFPRLDTNGQCLPSHGSCKYGSRIPIPGAVGAAALLAISQQRSLLPSVRRALEQHGL
jgi:hypothetical protein